jgi:hypothetical protein
VGGKKQPLIMIYIAISMTYAFVVLS